MVHNMLNKAIQLATQAHADQVDKAGEPYILHPLRVMLRLSDELERICGVLHDTVENTYITFEILRQEGFSEEVIEVIDYLTRREEECYEEFIERLLANLTACKVKLADLSDNSDPSRTKNETLRDRERTEKYNIATRRISIHISKYMNQ